MSGGRSGLGGDSLSLVVIHRWPPSLVFTPRNRPSGPIASWALRLCLSYGGASGWSIEQPAGGQWPELYRACAALLDHPFIRRIIRASCTGLYVDEYQDCSAVQHRLVLKLSGGRGSI